MITKHKRNTNNTDTSSYHISIANRIPIIYSLIVFIRLDAYQSVPGVKLIPSLYAELPSRSLRCTVGCGIFIFVISLSYTTYKIALACRFANFP